MPLAGRLLRPPPASALLPAALPLSSPMSSSAPAVADHAEAARQSRHATPLPSIPAQAGSGPVLQAGANGVIDWSHGRISSAADTADPVVALLQTLGGLRVDADSRVRDWLAKYPLLSTRVDALIRRHSKQDPSGRVVNAALALHGGDGLSALLLAFKLHDAPRRGDIGGQQTGGDAITLILDARGLAIQPALFPRLISGQGHDLHALSRADPNRVAEQGFSAYVSSLRAARGRLSSGQASRLIKVQGPTARAVTDLIVDGDLPQRIDAPIIIVTDRPTDRPADSGR